MAGSVPYKGIHFRQSNTDVIIFYFGFNFLKGLDMFSRNNEYYAYYADVQGLQASNPVTFNGVNVGRVMEIEPVQKNNIVKVRCVKIVFKIL